MDPLPDRTNGRIIGLDGIRGLAVSMVVAWHYLPCQLERDLMFAHAMPLWSYVTFSQNILMGIEGHFGAGMLAVTWSLAVEEQFYLAMPLLVLVAGRRGLVWLVPARLVAIPALRFLSPGFHAYVNTTWRADSLLAGAAVALLARSEAGLAAIRAAKAKLGMLGALLAAVVPLVVI